MTAFLAAEGAFPAGALEAGAFPAVEAGFYRSNVSNDHRVQESVVVTLSATLGAICAVVGVRERGDRALEHFILWSEIACFSGGAAST